MSSETDKALGVTRETPQQKSQNSPNDPARWASSKYPALNWVVVILKAVAVISLIASLVTGINIADPSTSYSQRSPRPELFFISLITGVITAVSLWAFADLLRVFMDIEQNTRRSNTDAP